MVPDSPLPPEGFPQPRPYDPSGFRYTSKVFPPYRHLPGVTPHPRLNPRGHEFGKKEIVPPPFDTARWWTSDEYLYGVDLYNFAFFWEAHEAWEGIWKTTGRGDLPGCFLQGLIQVSAALLKREQNIARGMRNLSRQGLERLHTVAQVHLNYCGIDLKDFMGRLGKIFVPKGAGWIEDPRIYLRETGGGRNAESRRQ